MRCRHHGMGRAIVDPCGDPEAAPWGHGGSICSLVNDEKRVLTPLKMASPAFGGQWIAPPFRAENRLPIFTGNAAGIPSGNEQESARVIAGTARIPRFMQAIREETRFRYIGTGRIIPAMMRPVRLLTKFRRTSCTIETGGVYASFGIFREQMDSFAEKNAFPFRPPPEKSADF